MSRDKSEAEKTRDRIHAKRGHLDANLDTVLIWLGRAAADPEQVPRWEPPDLTPGKPTPANPHVSGGRIGDRTGNQAAEAVTVVNNVIRQTHDVLEKLASDRFNRCGGHPPRRDLNPAGRPAHFAVMFRQAREDGKLLVAEADRNYAPPEGEHGMGASELAWYFLAPLQDAAGSLHGMIRHWAMEGETSVRRCANGCGGAAPPKGKGATCGRCRTRQYRERLAS